MTQVLGSTGDTHRGDARGTIRRARRRGTDPQAARIRLLARIARRCPRAPSRLIALVLLAASFSTFRLPAAFRFRYNPAEIFRSALAYGPTARVTQFCGGGIFKWQLLHRRSLRLSRRNPSIILAA